MSFKDRFRKGPSADEIREEIESHLAMSAEHEGTGQEMARRRFGNRLLAQEAVRRVWIADFLDTLVQDARFTWRSWTHNPGFALTAVLVLALGLGASTAMFSALDRILFRPLPYPNPDRLVNVGMTIPAFGSGPSQVLLVTRGYQDGWRPAPEPFAAVTTVMGADNTCDVTEQQPERLVCPTVESNFLRTLGVRPALGRDFTPEDDTRGAPPVAIISHELWTRRFGTDPRAIGRTIELDGSPVPVIGVLPDGFAMPTGEGHILRPQRIYPLDPSNLFGGFLRAFGRLKPGVTLEQAQAAIAPIIKENAERLPRISKDQGQPRIVPLRQYLIGDAARVSWLMLGAVAGLLLIACVNVANLVLARLAARNREFEVRSALGAGRARLARLALTEASCWPWWVADSDYCSPRRCYESSSAWRRPAFLKSAKPRLISACSLSPLC